MIFSEKGRGAPFLRKNHPLNQQCPLCYGQRIYSGLGKIFGNLSDK
jgi:hypothetical protein